MSRTSRQQLHVQRLEDRTVPATVFTERAGGDGYARVPNERNGEPGVAMTEFQTNEVASVSKPITTVALLRLFQDQIGNAADYPQALRDKLDQPMVDFLPSDWWSFDPTVPNITIGHLLRHESGFRTYALGYDAVRDVVQAGTGEPGDQSHPGPGVASYSTTNFSLLREMIPYLWGEVDRDILEGQASPTGMPQYLQDAMAELYPATATADLTPAQLSAGLYNYYVRTRVFEPAGVPTPTPSRPAPPPTR
ncbi:MAG TPA: serine hydrolase domain-containing protein [Gemmataceae bacterium]|nr:serine hydrolase domain-containing protein [Gemmataceae bacterium]